MEGPSNQGGQSAPNAGDASEEVGPSPTSSSRPSGRRYVEGDVVGGKYRLRSVLGEGGMGAVWLARNTVLEVDVAIKLIRHGVASPEASERLLQEARAAARLEHPSIVRIFDFGATEEGDPFIAMEVLRGESLARLLDRRGRLSGGNAVRTLLPVVSAVCAAHAKGIIHRDLKPDNVVLTENDAGTIVPKVVDFGIAKMHEGGIANRSLTQAGTIVGSPDYMCPEQARGRSDISGKCDVWALSVILYECLTGQRPFDGDNYNALLNSIIEDEPTPTTEFAAGDEALWKILQVGLAKDPAARPTMRELGEQLAQWAFDGGVDSDLSGAALTQWLGVPSQRRQSDRPVTDGPVSVRTARRREAVTRASLVEIEVPRGSTLPSAPADAGGGTQAEWTTTPPKRRKLGIAAVPVLLVAVGGAAWFALRTSAAREGDAHPVAAAMAASVAGPPPAPAPPPPTTAAAPASSSGPAEQGPIVSPASSAAPPATAASVASPAPHTGHAHPPAEHPAAHPGAAPAKAAGPTLAVPARPNF